MSNFACIGVADEDAERVLDHAAEHAEPAGESRGARHLLWRDDSGAGLGFHVVRDAIVCVTPFFAAEEPTLWPVLGATASHDAECVHCSGADCDLADAAGELATRACVQWLCFAPYRSWLRDERRFDLEVVAFASEARVCADEAALQEALAGGDDPASAGPGFAGNVFLPTGMVGDADEDGMLGRARALFAGPIEAAERRTNRVTGRDFHLLRVAPLPGPVNVVAAEVDGDPQPGALLLVEAWLVGRPPEPAPAPGRFARLLRR